ncbi:hypothetical protein KCP69_18685 [Salmonella enterica subsp. enterica]|nr:hypothetical protein KCP69_18685 [Salmonella enterica subsp. enterica]
MERSSSDIAHSVQAHFICAPLTPRCRIFITESVSDKRVLMTHGKFVWPRCRCFIPAPEAFGLARGLPVMADKPSRLAALRNDTGGCSGRSTEQRLAGATPHFFASAPVLRRLLHGRTINLAGTALGELAAQSAQLGNRFK